MNSKQAFSLFYAWQSDRPGNHCKRLIREALDIAAEAINADEEMPWRLEIDQDTAGVTGLCDIPAVIIEKIEKSDSFLCDLTYVATTVAAEGKLEGEFDSRFCSNPNVLFELGVAFQSVGWNRLILVMNENYGPVTKQAFDLAHRRHPVAYSYPHEGMSRVEVVEGLARELERIIRDMMIAHGPRELRSDSGLARFLRVRQDFEQAVRTNDFHRVQRHSGAIAITISSAEGTRIEFEEINQQLLPPPSQSSRIGWNPEILAIPFVPKQMHE